MAPTERALALAGPLRAALLALEQGLEPAGGLRSGGGRARVHDHDERLRRLRDAAAPARPPAARGARRAPAGARLAGARRARPSSRAATRTWCWDSTAGCPPVTTRRRCSRIGSCSSRARATRSCAERSRSRRTRSWRTCWCRTSRTRAASSTICSPSAASPATSPCACLTSCWCRRSSRRRITWRRSARSSPSRPRSSIDCSCSRCRSTFEAAMVHMVWHERTGGVAGARLAAGRRGGGGAGDRDVVPEAAAGIEDRVIDRAAAAALTRTATRRQCIMSLGPRRGMRGSSVVSLLILATARVGVRDAVTAVDPNPSGAAGDNGATGSGGTNGAAGMTGAAGSGTTGTAGTTGSAGNSATAGTTGAAGSTATRNRGGGRQRRDGDAAASRGGRGGAAGAGGRGGTQRARRGRRGGAAARRTAGTARQRGRARRHRRGSGRQRGRARRHDGQRRHRGRPRRHHGQRRRRVVEPLHLADRERQPVGQLDDQRQRHLRRRHEALHRVGHRWAAAARTRARPRCSRSPTAARCRT